MKIILAAFVTLLFFLCACAHQPTRDELNIRIIEDVKKDQIKIDELRRLAIDRVVSERVKKYDSEN